MPVPGRTPVELGAYFRLYDTAQPPGLGLRTPTAVFHKDPVPQDEASLHGGEKCPALASLAGAAVLDANAPVFGLGVSQLNWRILDCREGGSYNDRITKAFTLEGHKHCQTPSI